jgi:hypothetical protein
MKWADDKGAIPANAHIYPKVIEDAQIQHDNYLKYK